MSVRRGRPPKGTALSREQVLREALALVDEEGLDAIGMRKLARRLGVDPMSLYNHVDGKDALLDGIAELLLAAIPPAPAGTSLGETLHGLACAFRGAMLDHPRAAPLVLTRQLDSVNALARTEAALAPLLAAGYPPDLAVHVVRAVLAFLVGTLSREVNATAAFSGTDHEAARRRRADLAASGLPAVVEAAPHLAVCDHEAEFEFGLKILLDALATFELQPGVGISS